jgi:cell division ATPase FtsA
MEDGKTKITMGGMISVKMQGRQYESIDVSSVFTIEKEFEQFTQEHLDSLEKKANDILRKQLETRTKLAFNEYNSKLQQIKKSAGY